MADETVAGAALILRDRLASARAAKGTAEDHAEGIPRIRETGLWATVTPEAEVAVGTGDSANPQRIVLTIEQMEKLVVWWNVRPIHHA